MKIKLFPQEQIYWDSIDFSQQSRQSIRNSINPAYSLVKSLIERKAIPEIRLRYFTDPALNLEGRGKSREDIFRQNNTTGDTILKHPHFHKYLEYFVAGPKLESRIISQCEKLIEECGRITSGDTLGFCELTGNQVKAYKLKKNEVCEEYYKLILELTGMEILAKEVRDSVRR